MKHFKKVLSVGLVSCMALSMLGCSKSKTEESGFTVEMKDQVVARISENYEALKAGEFNVIRENLDGYTHYIWTDCYMTFATDVKVSCDLISPYVYSSLDNINYEFSELYDDNSFKVKITGDVLDYHEAFDATVSQDIDIISNFVSTKLSVSPDESVITDFYEQFKTDFGANYANVTNRVPYSATITGIFNEDGSFSFTHYAEDFEVFIMKVDDAQIATFEEIAAENNELNLDDMYEENPDLVLGIFTEEELESLNIEN